MIFAPPQLSEYKIAIASKKAFSNTYLNSLIFEKDKRGELKYDGGNFGITFFVTDSNSKKKVLKVYTESDPTRNERYLKLKTYLSTNSVSGFIGYEYYADGINVDGDLFPVLLMERVEGESLTDSIKSLYNSRDTSELNKLSQKILSLSQNLNDRKISHGDIHPNNIIIDGKGDLNLVDYDDVWIENIVDIVPIGGGVESFQHPLRSKKEYSGVEIDFFAFGVIYISIMILIKSIDARFTFIEKRLLFGLDEFESIISGNPNEQIRIYLNSDNFDIRIWLAVLVNELLLVRNIKQIPQAKASVFALLYQKYAKNWEPNSYTYYNPKTKDFFLRVS